MLDVTQGRARDNLRTALWRLRQDCPGLVAQYGAGIGIDDAVAVDMVKTRQWAWATLRGEGGIPPPDTVAKELLPGWGEEWLVEPREELRMLALYALEAAAHHLLLAGNVGEAACVTRAALSVDQLRESANRLLIEILLAAGNPADAVRQYWRYEELLRRQLGTAPSAALTALVAPILSPGRSRTDHGFKVAADRAGSNGRIGRGTRR